MRRKAVVTLLALPLFAAGISDQKVVSWVQAKVRKMEPTKADRRFDEVGWVNTMGEALKISKDTGRPVFLFTYDGDLATGRC